MLDEEFSKNAEFAKLHNIKTDPNYIVKIYYLNIVFEPYLIMIIKVTPHHSGLYPILPSLYNLFNEKYSFQAASAQGYPLNHPMHSRRGFIYDNFMVAPRLSAFMYTNNLNFDSARKSYDYWISLYEGGGLFEILLYNQVLWYILVLLLLLLITLYFLGSHTDDTFTEFCS
jgi:hypothetical protein